MGRLVDGAVNELSKGGCEGVFEKLKWLKCKRVSGGSVEESCCINGLVFAGNVVHKRMRCTISNPRVMLLGCGIEYERDSRSQNLNPKP
jgi:chaperonin GroEL (HSP60 family)